MKNVFVKIAAFCAALSIIGSFAACGKTPTTDESTTQALTTEAILTTEEATTTATSQGFTEAITEPADATTEAATEVETTEDDGLPKTKAEVIALCNDAVNAVKANKAGFKKVYKRDATGDISGLPSWLSDIIHKDETTTQSKGKDATDVFPAAGYSWSSHLRESDVKSYSVSQNGDYILIHLALGTEKNPAPGEASSYGRCMSVVTVDSAQSIPGISNVSMDYHDGYVDAKIDSKTGKVVECTFSAAADVSADVAILGNIRVNNIVSSETFSNFVW